MSNIKDTNRDLGALNILVAALAKVALDKIRAAKVNPLVVETYRSKDRQYYLYCKGRTEAQARAAGVPAAKAKEYITLLKKDKDPGDRVTWTLNSLHLGGQAIDVVPQRVVNGKNTAIWNAKDKETIKIISIMTKYGFEAGANWANSPDSPHFQIKCAGLGNVFDRTHTTSYVTKAIQTALNKAKLKGIKPLVVDGSWGAKTDEAVSAFRKFMKYSSSRPILGRAAILALFKYL